MINGTRYRLSAEINRQADLAKDIAKIQAQIATRKRIQAPSDDPVGAAQLAGIVRSQGDEEAWTRNLGTAGAISDGAFNVLGTLMTRIDRASELLTSVNGSTSVEGRVAIAAELNEIAAEIEALALARDVRGEPIFRSGSQLEIPVGPDLRITPALGREQAFGPIVTAGGPMDLAAIVRSAATAATVSDATARQAALDASRDAMEIALSHTTRVRAEQSIRGTRIASLEESMANSSLVLSEQRMAVEETDLVRAIARLEATKLSLDAAQAVFARVNQTSLFDLLR